MGKGRRHRMTFYKGVTAISAVLLSFFSCKDDSYQYPPVKTDFVSVTTNHEGRVDSLFDDNGKKYVLSLAQDDLAKDSLYRCVATYSADGDGLHLYALQNIVSPDPMKYEKMKTDAVSSIRIWRGSSYINVIVKALGQTKSHKWGLNEDGLSRTENGRKRLSFTLYHDMNGDYPAFSRQVYLSFPLRKYADRLTKGDSIFVSVHQTVKDKDSVIVYPLGY